MAKNIWEETLQRSGAPSVGLGQVTEALSATLKQYLETHQVKNLAELIRSLNPERPAEAVQSVNPYSGVREVVTTVAELTSPQRQALADTERQLAEERQRHFDTQLKLVQAAKENRAEEVKAEMSATQAMLTFLQTAMQSNNALLKELVETKIQSATQVASRQEEPSSLRQFYDKIVSGALEEFFSRRMQQVQAKPSVLEQAREFRTLYEEMRQLFPQAGPGEQTDRLRERLELERLGMEERVKLRELELQDQREREREKARTQFIAELRSIVSDVVEALRFHPGQKAGPASRPAAEAPPGPPEVICPSCGERFSHPGTKEFACPRCSLALTTEPPKPPPPQGGVDGRSAGLRPSVVEF